MNPQTWACQISVAVVVATTLTACATGSSPDESNEPVAAAGAVAAAIDEAGPALSEALIFEGDPFLDYDVADDWLAATAVAIDDLRAALPDSLGSASDEQEAPFRDVLDALSAWDAEVEEVRGELERRRNELEPLALAWAEERVGPPPSAFLDLLGRNDSAATTFGDACATFVASFDLVADCYGYLGELLPADPDGLPAKKYEVVVDELTLAWDQSGVTFTDETVGATVTTTPTLSLAVGAPPRVADPTAPPHRDETLAIEDSIPWPQDVAVWYAQLPVSVLDDGTVELPSGSGTQSWTYVVLEGTEEEQVAIVDFGGLGSALTGPDWEIVLWWTQIDGTDVVAVSGGAPSLPFRTHLADAQQVLTTLRRG